MLKCITVTTILFFLNLKLEETGTRLTCHKVGTWEKWSSFFPPPLSLSCLVFYFLIVSDEILLKFIWSLDSYQCS